MSDLIRREDAIKALEREKSDWNCDYNVPIDNCIKRLNKVKSADRPQEVIYGNEHNCIMTIFGECSYAETGCGDCAVVEKVRKALSADRPQGEWVSDYSSPIAYRCTVCNTLQHWSVIQNGRYRFCPNCGARMKGADDE